MPSKQEIESATKALIKLWKTLDNTVGAFTEAGLFAEVALEAAEKVRWQPIETAPKDGTQLILWDNRYKKYHLGCFEKGQWLSGYEGGEFDFSINLKPTHWQPLPEPPKAEDLENGNK